MSRGIFDGRHLQIRDVFRSVILGQSAGQVCQTAPQDVSEKEDTAIGSLSDEAREAAITRAGDLMERRYAAFALSGDLADLGDAHRAMLQMKALIAGRSKDAVLRMEIRKG
jgi:hypothetical protein